MPVCTVYLKSKSKGKVSKRRVTSSIMNKEIKKLKKKGFKHCEIPCRLKNNQYFVKTECR